MKLFPRTGPLKAAVVGLAAMTKGSKGTVSWDKVHLRIDGLGIVIRHYVNQLRHRSFSPEADGEM